MKVNGHLILVMRLTDDYLILSNNQSCIQKIVDDLFVCADQSNFQFNLKKLRANFQMENFQMENDNEHFKWIGKIFDLN